MYKEQSYIAITEPSKRCKYISYVIWPFQIIDEKSLIKKYQREISCLKEELDLLKRGIMENQKVGPSQDDLVNLKLQVHHILTHQLTC